MLFFRGCVVGVTENALRALKTLKEAKVLQIILWPSIVEEMARWSPGVTNRLVMPVTLGAVVR